MRMLSLCVVLVLMGAGCVERTTSSWEDTRTDPIDYAIENRNVRVAHFIKEADDVFSLDRIARNMERCKKTVDQHDLARLGVTLKRLPVHIYNFTYIGNAPGEATWEVVALPNAFGFDTGSDFRKYFDECAVGASLEPYRMSRDWLLLASECEKRTGPEVTGCDIAHRAVRGSLDPK